MLKLYKSCFFITPIGEESSPERLRADYMLKVIKQILSEFGFDETNIIAAHNINSPGVITNQVIKQVTSASIVIADLSGLNPNVMYELALRHFTYLPVIQICDDSTTLPFDVKTMRTIFYNFDGKVNSGFKRELRATYESIEKKSSIDNPMKDIVGIDLFNNLTGISGIKRLSSLNEMYFQMTCKMRDAKISVDDITWATTTFYRTKSDRNSYEEYKMTMQEILEKKDIKYREISSIGHQSYLWRVEELLKFYNYNIGYYEVPKIPLISYMVIDNKDAFIGFYRDPFLPIDDEVYLHITNKDVIAFLVDYYQTLWSGSVKVKEGDTVDYKTLESIKRRFIN